MFDTVHVWAQLVDPDRVVSRLSGVHVKTIGRPGYVGWLPSGVRVEVYGDHASVQLQVPTLAGSPDPSAAQLASIIAATEEELGERLDSASVSRLDVFADLPLARPAADYLDLLVWKPNVPRDTRRDESTRTLQTVAFGGKACYHHYYDRPARLRSKGIPAEGDVVRYELQHRRAVGRMFGGRVIPADLSCPTFRARCADRWLEHHGHVLSLPAVRPFTYGMDPRSHAALIGHLAAPEAFGVYEATFEMGVECGALTTKQRDRENGKLRALIKDSRYALPHPLRVELDGLVEDAAARMAGGRKRIV